MADISDAFKPIFKICDKLVVELENIEVIGFIFPADKIAAVTHYQLYKKVLSENGWRIKDCVHNSYPPYKIRYRVINTILSEKHASVPRIRINEQDCKSLLISLKHTPIIGDNFEKDESSEDSKTLDQQYSTHLSDAFDYILFKKYSRIVPIASAGSGPRFGKSG